MAPIIMESHQAQQASWAADGRHAWAAGTRGAPQQQQQWAPGGQQMHINHSMVLARDLIDEGGFAASVHGLGPTARSLQRGLPQGPMGRELLGEGSFMGRGYSIKRCQGFVRCDMDIDAEVVGWVIGKNGSTIKDMKHKTGCNMWVDQRALKLTITGPDLSSVEHAAKSVDAYVAAAPIKAGAVEAAMTKTLDCPAHLLDVLGDRTTIARIVKETHAQVVVNKKIGKIIVRGDHRSVDLACSSVQATIHAALHGGLGLHVNTPDSLGPHGGSGYFSSGGGGSGGGRSGGLSPGDGMSGMGGGGGGGMHMMPTHLPEFRALDMPEFRSLGSWQQQQQQQQLQLQLQHHRGHRSGDGRGSDTDESEIETVSLGSIGARTPVSSTAGSPRAGASYTTSPALSGAASTPGGDWSLFSGGFGLGMAALQEGSSTTSTPTTSRNTARVHFPEGLAALTGNDTVLGSSNSADDDASQVGEGKDGAPGGHSGAVLGGALAPPPSPASTSGEASRKTQGALIADAYALDALEGTDGEDDDEEGEDIADKVARLGKRLQAMGLGKYCPKFAENEVDLEALGLMSEGDLADIGIPKGPRLKILNAVGRGNNTPTA